ncbi:hypothetical protein AMTRI_Chr04g181500 [Amborella trichopoda]
MEKTNTNVSLDGGPVALRRKRAARYAAYFSGSARSQLSRSKSKGIYGKPCERESFNSCIHGLRCSSVKSIVNNYENFLKSGLPRRLMYLSYGDWIDFPKFAANLLIEAFKVRNSAIEVILDGCLYLVDFLHMVRINLESGVQQSVAWIDEFDKCFFPKLFFDGSVLPACLVCNGTSGEKNRHGAMNENRGIEVKVEIGISGADSSKPEDWGEVSISHVKAIKAQKSLPSNERSELEQDTSTTRNPSADAKEVIAENGAIPPIGYGESKSPISGIQNSSNRSSGSREIIRENGASPPLGYEESRLPVSGIQNVMPMDCGLGHEKLVLLDRGCNDYDMVQNMFVAGFGMFLTASNIVGIYCNSPTSSSVQARLQSFQKQIEITKSYRGNANVRQAWHGSFKLGVSGIMLHGFGFGQSGKPRNGVAYGIGIYLSPEDCSYLSANYCDVDENGVQHMVLCRIIMGNMEQVQPGSEQFHPSSEKFDSGVDDLQNPKHYIIWSTHMNTHIYPEYVVSFKVPPNIQEYWGGLKGTWSPVGVPGVPLRDSQLKHEASSVDLARDGQKSDILKGSEEKLQENVPKTVKMPTSAWMPFPVLFAAIEKNISPVDKDLLDRYYTDFKTKKITREELIKKLRLVIGDKLLISTLKNLQGRRAGNQATKENHNQQGKVKKGNDVAFDSPGGTSESNA